MATHICDSIKRRLKADGDCAGLQGEFGNGLLSFWTVGDAPACRSRKIVVSQLVNPVVRFDFRLIRSRGKELPPGAVTEEVGCEAGKAGREAHCPKCE